MKIEEKIAGFLVDTSSTLSAAESCTGGYISHIITTVSGASSYFLGSVTSYAISVKENILGVPADLITRHGVVSSEVASAMAEGIRKITGSTYSVATTGLAEGGNDKYPEGTVWIAVSGPDGTVSYMYQNGKSDRKNNIRQFSHAALSFLLRYLISKANH